MSGQQQISFGSFRLDLGSEQVWRGQQAIPLKPKTFSVLRYLVTHAGRLVTKEELLDALWPDVHVSDGVLKVCVRELRRALGDKAQTPQYITTVHRRGYRFIGIVRSHRSEPASSTQHLTLTLVGRETEVRQLHRLLEKARSGERQIIFITGEPGIGKTALVEAFLDQIATEGELWLGRGQCIEHFGAGEAYLPILEALGRLCREPGGEQLITLLNQYAPTWLVQMPALLGAADLEMVQRKAQSATRERMLRELAEAVEVLTVERALVLWLEDLQWSDYSTLEWISALARRRERTRLLLIGTYRPVDVILNAHPLKAVKQELQMQRCSEELPLALLSEAAVDEYLAVRFGFPSIVREACPEPVAFTQDKLRLRGQSEGLSPLSLRRLVRLIHQRTDGNPLFMVNVVDALVNEGWITATAGQWSLKAGIEQAAVGVPESLQQTIEQRLERVQPVERITLEAASVAGATFSAAAVAAGVESPLEAVETQCAELARRQMFLRACGTDEWPDGTVATRYGFLHALYQEVLYERLPAGRRQRLHQRIGEREEKGYGERTREIAAELAVHFERGRDYPRAIRYLQQAGENAIWRSAQQEAISLLTKGLEVLKTLPNTPERIEQELTLQITLGPLLAMTKGYGAPEVGTVYARALDLCQQIGETPHLFWVLMGLFAFYGLRGELQTARQLAQQSLHVAQSAQDSVLLMHAHGTLGTCLYCAGEFAAARVHAEQAIILADLQQHRPSAMSQGLDPEVRARSVASWILWTLGYPEQARRRNHEALALARELSNWHTLAFALNNAVVLHRYCKEWQAAQVLAEELIALATEQGLPLFLAQGKFYWNWTLAEQGQEEGITQMHQNLAARRATGMELGQPCLLTLLAESYGKVGRAEEGLNVLAEAFAVMGKTGESDDEVEMYRLKGTLTLQAKTTQGQVENKSKTRDGQVEDNPQVANLQSLAPNPHAESEAEACFHKAIEIARRQQAKSLELRAVLSLSRLWQQQGKKAEARQMLVEIYGWFTEGFDTKDLQEAKALLEELA
jgi:predicted ATPase/DNA-binding winged helix-turn-helix (wHTH) protein